MKLLGLRIISESHYQELEKQSIAFSTMVQCHRWFSGWRDLDIIWDYIFGNRNFGGISEARRDYAKARNTDDYGKPL
jgi:hypothetical protein